MDTSPSRQMVAAKKAIANVFSDTSCSQAETREQLEELRDDIDERLSCLTE